MRNEIKRLFWRSQHEEDRNAGITLHGGESPRRVGSIVSDSARFYKTCLELKPANQRNSAI